MPDHQPARVIVVAGPSGSGKTVLCRLLSRDRGWPVVNLDDFYKDGDDPTLPLVELPGGQRPRRLAVGGSPARAIDGDVAHGAHQRSSDPVVEHRRLGHEADQPPTP